MKQAIYIINLPHSAAIKQSQAIEAAIKEVLDGFSWQHNESADNPVEAVGKCVTPARLAVDVEGAVKGTFKCVGFQFFLNSVQASLALTGKSGNLQHETALIQERIAAVKIPCPPITYAEGGLYLPCNTCGGCSAVIELADLLENEYGVGGDPVACPDRVYRGCADRTSFTYASGKLNIFEASDARETMAEFAKSLRQEINEHNNRKPGERV